MDRLRKRPIVILLFFGLLIRVSLLFVDYSFDVNNHIIWAKDLHTFGWRGFFEHPSSQTFAHEYPNYPPLSLFLFYFVYPLPQLLFSVAWFLNIHISLFPSNLVHLFEQRYFLAAVMKLPAVFFDGALAVLIYLFARKIAPQKKKVGLIAASFVLFNPVFFYNSAFWGQIDVIPLFFVLWAYYLMEYSKRPFLSALVFTASLAFKPTTLIFIPMYALFYYQKFKLKQTLIAGVLSVAFFWASFLPFLSNISIVKPFQLYWANIIQAQSLPYVTNGAFNAWLFIVRFEDAVKDTMPFILGFSYRVVGYAVVGGLSLGILYKAMRMKEKTKGFLISSFLIAFASFLFLTKMHERYFMLPLPFLILMYVKDELLKKWIYVLSFLAFINLYHSWAVPFIKPVFDIIDTPLTYIVLSACAVIVFFLLIVRFVDKKGKGSGIF